MTDQETAAIGADDAYRQWSQTLKGSAGAQPTITRTTVNPKTGKRAVRASAVLTTAEWWEKHSAGAAEVRTLTMREARQSFAEVLDAAEYGGTVTVVTNYGRPLAAFVPPALHSAAGK
ncbi:type II toxin-antitoxin system Phd/YefM family antitoxin [Streptomyces sp. NPDC015492]|uniref:type II toxin-antitoxin system Phd/YefM family antitoxin n=1 Tax=Streptomyces sp. NPDC015492 TaxID=3364958 RepID=UPI0036FA7EF8